MAFCNCVCRRNVADIGICVCSERTFKTGDKTIIVHFSYVVVMFLVI
jgi:hypothetical protein